MTDVGPKNQLQVRVLSLVDPTRVRTPPPPSSSCVDVWLSQNPTCPFCKQTVEVVPPHDRTKGPAARIGASVTMMRNLPRWLRRSNGSLDGDGNATAPPVPESAAAAASSTTGSAERNTASNVAVEAGGGGASAAPGGESAQQNSTFLLAAPFGGLDGELPVESEARAGRDELLQAPLGGGAETEDHGTEAKAETEEPEAVNTEAVGDRGARGRTSSGGEGERLEENGRIDRADLV